MIKKQVTPWSFLTSGPPFEIKDFDGRRIQYQGIDFSGSPRDVFWSNYIEPFLQELCLKEIQEAISIAEKKEVDAKLLLLEVYKLLSSGISKVYERMADIDRRLRGKGYPQKVESRPVHNEIKRMTQFIKDHIKAELKMWKPLSQPEKWFRKNQFWVWIATVLLSFLSFLLSLIALWA